MATQVQNKSVQGSLSILAGASLFGLFWIPLRYLDEQGLTALWTVAAINLVGLIIAVPMLFFSGESPGKNVKALLIVSAGMGLSNILYFAGIILSDVVRVVFLFYLLPLWATLFSWGIFGEKIGQARMLALAIAAVGIWLLLGTGGLPIPQNLGDIFGLLAGIGWAFGLAMLRGKPDIGAAHTTAISMAFACVGALILGFTLHRFIPEVQPAFPTANIITPLVVPLIAFGVLILWPCIFGQIWGAQYVAATTAALLTMSEIILATISYYIFEDPEMEFISWIGAILILSAIFIDLFGNRDA